MRCGCDAGNRESNPSCAARPPSRWRARTSCSAASQAFGIWFQLIALAEQNATMRRLRHTEAERGPEEVPGTFAHVLCEAARAGIPAETIQALLRDARIRPVLTAHPTEAKRVTVLEIHRRIYRKLTELEQPRWAPRERDLLISDLASEIELLWMTGELLLERPSVQREIAWGLHFFREVIFEATPKLYEMAESAFKLCYPNHNAEAPSFMRYASWIGGDRDGNPNVTAGITAYALSEYRDAAIDWHRAQLRRLLTVLSVSTNVVDLPAEFVRVLARALERSGAGSSIVARNPDEPLRQFAAAMMRRIEAVRCEGDAVPYPGAEALRADLMALEKVLEQIGGSQVAKRFVLPLRRQVESFGFHTVSLDIRQNSTVVNRVLAELLATGDGAPSAQPGESGWSERIRAALKSSARPELAPDRMSDEARELLDLFAVIRAAPGGSVGAFILSMTRSADDILAVYLLAHWCRPTMAPDGSGPIRLRIVPLFETIADLRAAPDILDELLGVSIVRRSIREFGNRQEVMLGYLRFQQGRWVPRVEWGQQGRQATAGRRRPEKTGSGSAFFTAAAARSAGAARRRPGRSPRSRRDTVGGVMRVTEQGEVVSSKFANRGTGLHQPGNTGGERPCATAVKSPSESEAKDSSEFGEALEALTGMSQGVLCGAHQRTRLHRLFQPGKPGRGTGAPEVSARARLAVSARAASPICAPSRGCSHGARIATCSPGGTASAARSIRSSRFAASLGFRC